ncbi:MAG: BRCT domain-containing protein [Planctomycetota bacterium]
MARQGGVHFSFLIVALVICLGLVGFAVIQNSDKEKLLQQLAAAEKGKAAEEQKARDRLAELTRARDVLFGKNSSSNAYEVVEEFLRQAPEEWAKASGDPSVSFASVDEFLRTSYDATKEWRRKYETQRAAATSKDESYLGEVDSKQKVVAAKEDEINTLKAKVEDLSTQLEAAEAEGRERAARLRQELEELTDTSTVQLAEKDKQIWVLRNQGDQLGKRIAHLESEIVTDKTFERSEPDGQIVEVADQLGYAWLNLGRNQRLRTGLVFDVFNFVKGGKKQRKGQIEVIKVEDDIAKARITGALDALNPISEGDFIASPFYSQADVPVFVFAGEKLISQRLSKDELVRKIGEYGGKVEDKVRIETTFVVALSGYETSDEYLSARRLGITIIGEQELLNFVGY